MKWRHWVAILKQYNLEVILLESNYTLQEKAWWKVGIVENTLVDWFLDIERAVIIGIGNPLRRDDNVGVEIVKRLKGTITKDNILIIEGESVPENFIEPITEFNPSHILLIDAALMGLKPGQPRFIEALKYLALLCPPTPFPFKSSAVIWYK